ncbi:hypothetical protein TrVFT333_011012 [Trichoderma virens FT-333]|nr:hypothetical protein TrVFT333_011012 [Trichoderma virens FT-333]
MSPLKTDFPAIRACIFDMDGLLINSEDIITQSTNQLLEKYSRPTFTRSIRAQLMGIPDSTNGDVFHNWAQLPILASNSLVNRANRCICFFRTASHCLVRRSFCQT